MSNADIVAAAIGRCVTAKVRAKLTRRGAGSAASVDAFGNRDHLFGLLRNWTQRGDAPELTTLAKLADALGCDLPDLVPTRAEVLAEMEVRR